MNTDKRSRAIKGRRMGTDESRTRKWARMKHGLERK
jgi:hypothetical protein